MKYFCAAIFIATIICLSYACYKTQQYGAVNPFNISNGNFFSYINLTSAINVHPVYFGIMLMLSIIILITDFIIPNPVLNYNSIIKVITILYFVGFLLLLNSFLLIILLGYVTTTVCGIAILKRKNLKHIVLFITGFLVICFIFSGFITEKFKGVHLSEDLHIKDFSGNDFTAVKARVAKATCAIDVIKDNFLLGTGIGDGNEELYNSYLKNGFMHGYIKKYNAHNQYLTTFINIGVVGFVILAFIIAVLFIASVKNKNLYLFFFISFFSVFFITESVLERQFGIVAFVFFGTFLQFPQKE